MKGIWPSKDEHPLSWHLVRGWNGGMAWLTPWRVLAIAAGTGCVISLSFDRGILPPFIYLFLFMAGAVFFSPLTLSGIIAGERESRSLELLLAAPVTMRQILGGKLLRVLPLNLAMLSLSLGGILTSLAAFAFLPNAVRADVSTPWTFWAACVSCGLVAPVALHVLVAWVSVKTRTRTSAALASIFAVMAFHALPPLLLGLITAFGGFSSLGSSTDWNPAMQVLHLSPFTQFGIPRENPAAGVAYIIISWVVWALVGVLAWRSAVRSLNLMRHHGLEN